MQLEDSECRAIDRIVRSSASSALTMLVATVVASPRIEVQFATAMCVPCRRAQGRRISNEQQAQQQQGLLKRSPSLAPLACPHCGLLTKESATGVVSPVLVEMAHVLVFKHVKPATLHRLAEMQFARRRQPTAPQTGRGQGEREWVNSESHTGLTVESFFREMERLYTTAKRGVFLPEDTLPTMSLSVADAALPAMMEHSSSTATMGRSLSA